MGRSLRFLAAGWIAGVFWLCAACKHAPPPALNERFPKPTLSVDISKWITNPESLPPTPSSIIQDAPTTPPSLRPGPLTPLALRDVLYTTLANNLDIRISELSRQNARDEIEATKGIYDLLLDASAQYERSLSGSRSNSESDSSSVTKEFDTDPLSPTFGQIVDVVRNSSENESRSRSLSTQRSAALQASLSQLLPTGGEVALGYAFLRARTFSQSSSISSNAQLTEEGLVGSSTESESENSSHNLSYLRTLSLSVTQPLLKGFGRTVTEQKILIARNDAESSREAFRLEVMQSLDRALKAYWDLVFAFNNMDVQKLSLSQAQDLLRINIVKFTTGWRPKTDVLQAQAQVATGQEQVITAQKKIQDVMDTLKSAMNLPKNSKEWTAQLVPQQKPSFFEVNYSEEDSIVEALQKRPEIRQANLTQKNNEINRVVTKNARLPDLNLTGSVGYVSPMTGEDYDYDNYSVGMELHYPLQNRQANAKYRQALTNMQSGEVAIEQSRQTITQDVRATLREIRTARERIDVSKAAVEYETAKLEAEKERYDVGISTTFQVLQFQKDFAQAQVNYLSAIVDYNKALIDFEVSKGSLLDRMGIEVEEYGVSGPSNTPKTPLYPVIGGAPDSGSVPTSQPSAGAQP